MQEVENTYNEFMDAFVKLPKETKRDEIVGKLREVIARMMELSYNLGLPEDELLLSKEILDLNKKPVSEDDYLEAVFAYINCLEDLLGKYLAKTLNVE